MRSRREKYCGAGITDALSHLLLKRKGGRDFTPSGRDIAGIYWMATFQVMQGHNTGLLVTTMQLTSSILILLFFPIRKINRSYFLRLVADVRPQLFSLFLCDTSSLVKTEVT